MEGDNFGHVGNEMEAAARFRSQQMSVPRRERCSKNDLVIGSPLSCQRRKAASAATNSEEPIHAVPASRRRSSSSFVMYPCMDDLSDSETTDIDVDEMFRRARRIRSVKAAKYVEHDADNELFSDPSCFLTHALDEQKYLDNLFEQRHKERLFDEGTKMMLGECAYAAHQSCTETTYEESTIFSDNMSPTCDSEYGLSVTSSSSILTPGRPRRVEATSAFEVYAPPFNSPAAIGVPTPFQRSPSLRWEESLPCANLMQEDRYEGAGGRTRAAFAAARPYNDSSRITRGSHHNPPQCRQPYYPSHSNQSLQREYVHDPCAYERQVATPPSRSPYYQDALPRHSSRRQLMPSHMVKPELQIEISPGLSMPLRSSQETIVAVESGYLAQLACLACETFLATVPDCQLVICPACRFLSPVEDGDCFQNGRAVIAQRSHGRRGIGLGLQI
ncbi:hypothetical protein MPSEU_000838900 [Mayamaea pseudoterrestris]|nr:hypothetical protein MPSEU_000838900 [Mayamaea pseudoterrestris]